MANPRREEKKAREHAARQARLAVERKERRVKVVALFIVIALIVGLIGTFATLADDNSSEEATSTSTTSETTSTTAPTAAIPPVPAGQTITGDTPCPAADGSTPRASTFEKAPSMCIDAAKNYTATFETTEGKVVVKLDTTKTPNTVNNFIVLSRYHYYDGSALFRTDPSIGIIQGGSPSTQDNTDQGPGYNIQDEGLPAKYVTGDLVMANTGAANSSGAQYFFGVSEKVNLLDNQGSYIKFGTTTEGLDVLQKILALSASPTASSAPTKPVIVNKITIAES